MAEKIWQLETDGSQTLATIDEISNALSGLLEKIAQVADASASLTGLEESLTQVATSATDTSAEFEGLTETIDQLSGAIAEDTSIIDTLNETIINLQAQIDMLTVSETGAEAEAGALAAALAGLGEMADTAGAALEAAQGPLMMLSAGAIMAGGAFMKMGMQGQDGIALVQGMAGATTQDIQGLESEALKLGENMDEASKGFYQIASAGYAGKDGLEVFDNSVKAAKASNSALGDVSSATTGIMHAYNLTAEDSGKITDELVQTTVQGKQSFGDLAHSIGPLAATAANLGISFDQVTAAEATMTQINPHVKQDTNQLASLMTALSSNIDKTATTAHGLGIKFDEAHYKTLDFMGKLEYLRQQCGHNETAFTKLVGGMNGVHASQDLLSGSGQTYINNLKAIQNSQGATDKAYERSEQTISASMDKIGAAMSVFATRTVEALGPKLTPILDGLATAIGHMADFVSAHMDIVMPILAGIAVFFGVIIVSAIAAFVVSIWSVISPFLAIAAVIGAVVAAVIYAIEHWGGITDWLKGVWAGFLGWYNGIFASIKEKWAGLESFFKGLWAGIVANSKTAWDDVSGAAQQGGANLVSWWHSVSESFAKSPLGSSIIKTLQDELGQIGPQLGQVGATMRTEIGGALSGIMPALTNLGNSFKVAFQQIAQAGQVIGSSFVSSWVILKGTFSALAPVLLQVGQMVAGTFVSSWKLLQGAMSALAPIFAQIGALIGGQVLNALKVFGMIIGGVVLIAIAGLLGAIVGLAKGLAVFIQGVAMVITGIIQVFSGIFQIVSGFTALIVDLCTGNFSKLGADLGTIWSGIKEMFAGVLNIIEGLFKAVILSVVTYVQGFVTTIISFFTNLYNSLVGHSIIPDMINGIISWFAQLPGRAISAIQALPGMIVNIWNTIINDAKNAGTNIIKGIADAITGALHFVTDAMTNVTSWISAHLPHSPAKEGPLKDLVYQGSMITDQIGQGMLAGVPKLQAVLGKITQPITAQLNPHVNTSLVPVTGGTASPPNSTGNNDQQIQLLGQILAELQKQGKGGNVTMNANVAAGSMDAQRINQIVQSLGGKAVEMMQRGGG